MRTAEDIESYLIESGYTFDRLNDTLWRVDDEVDDVENLLVYISGTVVNFQMMLFELPKEPSVALLRRLLEFNDESLIHGAFAIHQGKVILIGALELQNLDRNALQAMVESMTLATSLHYDELRALID